MVHQLMKEFNSQEASSPAQQGSPLSVTQHANNSLDEPVSDSNVSTTNHGLAAVGADEWVDEGEEIEVQWMSKGYNHHHHHPYPPHHHHHLLYAGYLYIYIPETNHVPRENSVSAILSLLFMVPISLVPALALLYF